MSTHEFSPSQDALRNYELACRLAREGDEQMRRWFAGELRPHPDDESARWAAIEARRAAGKPRYVLRQRVGMPRGVQPVRRRERRPSGWAIASFALLALWGVWLAVAL